MGFQIRDMAPESPILLRNMGRTTTEKATHEWFAAREQIERSGFNEHHSFLLQVSTSIICSLREKMEPEWKSEL